MKQINLGNSNWQVSAVAFGTWRMTSRNNISLDQATKALEAAYNCGINFIDSSDVYGRGESEKLLGQALRNSNIKRDDVFIQTKGGIIPHQRYDFSKKHLLEAVDQSLERLGLDYLDAYVLHRPDPLMEPEEVAAAFDQLQREGKVRHFGVSNFNTQQFLLLQGSLNQKLLVDQLEFGLKHTGMIDHGIHANMSDDRSIDHDGEFLEFARRNGITIQAWSPFQLSNYGGLFINNPDYPQLNQALQNLAEKHHVSKNAIALAWILRHPANFQVLIGSMNPDHIIDNAKGADIKLTRQEWYDLYLAAGNDLP